MQSHTVSGGCADQQDAFDTLNLKERISQIGPLYFLDYARPLHVAVDASEDGVGGYLPVWQATAATVTGSLSWSSPGTSAEEQLRSPLVYAGPNLTLIGHYSTEPHG